MPAPQLDHKTTGYGPMVQVIIDHICDEITALHLTANDTVEMAAVAERHGATIMNAHRAFETLEFYRFADYDRDARTASVRFGAADITKLTQSRLDLELKALRRACVMPNKSDWAIISRSTYNNEAKKSPDMMFHQHMTFHCCLYGPGGTKYDTREYVWLMEDFKKYFLHLWRDPQSFVAHMNVAREVFRLCMEGEDEAACDMQARYIEETRDRVLRNIHLRDSDIGGIRTEPT